MNREEVSLKRMIVELGMAVVIGVVAVKVQRAASRPDFGRTFAMGRVWAIKQYAESRVRFWENVRGEAASAYNRMKP